MACTKSHPSDTKGDSSQPKENILENTTANPCVFHMKGILLLIGMSKQIIGSKTTSCFVKVNKVNNMNVLLGGGGVYMESFVPVLWLLKLLAPAVISFSLPCPVKPEAHLQFL